MIQGSLTKMDGVSAAKGLTTFSRSGNLIIDTFIQSYAFIVGIGAIPVRLYYRENLGERAFSPFALIACIIFYGYIGIKGGIIITGLVTQLILDIDILGPTFSLGAYLIYYTLSPISLLVVFTASMGRKHFKKVFKEPDNSNVVRYSYYRGDTRYFKEYIGKVNSRGKVLTEQYLRMNFEPRKAAWFGFLLFITPLILIYLNSTINIELFYIVYFYFGFFLITGLSVMFSSFCVYLEEFGIKLRVRGKILDMTDGEYDMMFIKAERDKLKLSSDSAQSDDKKILNKISDEDSIVVS